MSDYDHVALLLRYSTGRLVIFEATSSTVTLYIFYMNIREYQYLIGMLLLSINGIQFMIDLHLGSFVDIQGLWILCRDWKNSYDPRSAKSINSQHQRYSNLKMLTINQKTKAFSVQSQWRALINVWIYFLQSQQQVNTGQEVFQTKEH